MREGEGESEGGKESERVRGRERERGRKEGGKRRLLYLISQGTKIN